MAEVTSLAVLMAAELELVAELTVIALPVTETLSGVDAPATTIVSVIALPVVPGTFAIRKMSLLTPVMLVVSVARLPMPWNHRGAHAF